MKHIVAGLAVFGLIAAFTVTSAAAGGSGLGQLAQNTQTENGRAGSSGSLTTPPTAPPAAPAPAAGANGSSGDKPAPDKSASNSGATDPLAKQAVGTIATLEGSATVTRGGVDTPLKVADYVLKGDILQTGPDSQLGLTFDDGTTFNLASNARMEVNNFAFQKGGNANAALFTVTRGTVGFTSSQVAKTGDLKIATPTMTLKGPGATGLIEIPDAGGASSSGSQVADAAVKLYSDKDGHTGRIDIYKTGAEDTRLAELTKSGTGYTIQSAASDITAVAIKIPPEQAKKDRTVVRRVFTIQVAGARLITQRQVLLGLPLPGIPGIVVPGVGGTLPVPVPAGILPGAPRRGRQPGFIPGIRF